MEKNKIFVIVLGILLLVSLGASLYHTYKLEISNLERDYYRDQMLDFCEASQVYEEIIDSLNNETIYGIRAYPCHYWILEDG